MVQTITEKKRSRAKAAVRAINSGKAEVGEKPVAGRDRKAREVKRTTATEERPKRTAGSRRRAMVTTSPQRGVGLQIEAILRELHEVKAMVEPFLPQLRSTDASTASPILEGAVDALRRLLSELIEHRMEEVVRDLVDVRREIASTPGDAGGPAMERLDRVLESLGAVKFEAQRFDVMDPLVHAAVEERHEDDVPDGVVLTTVRPGFRTGRGLVVGKAAVAVSRRA